MRLNDKYIWLCVHQPLNQIMHEFLFVNIFVEFGNDQCAYLWRPVPIFIWDEVPSKTCQKELYILQNLKWKEQLLLVYVNTSNLTLAVISVKESMTSETILTFELTYQLRLHFGYIFSKSLVFINLQAATQT